MSARPSDVASELLIADLLEEDLRNVAKEIQHLGNAQQSESLKDDADQLNDFAVALAMLAADVRMSGDAAYAQALQHSDDAASIANRQYAQQLLAAEKKIALDAEFARRLQQLEDRGTAGNDTNDIETVLGKRGIDQVLAENPNEKGKGKTRSISPKQSEFRLTKRTKLIGETLTDPTETQEFEPLSVMCGICFQECQLVHSPVNAANIHEAASSTQLPFAINMPCPAAHPYCHACLVRYIKSKVDPFDDGSCNPDSIVFPIKCPGCPFANWEKGIGDDVAVRVLSEEDMVIWALPPDERSPEDQQALQLMRRNKWRRCPECMFIVELAIGCNHITCRCGTQFCFKCGAKWDVKRRKCSRSNPSCDMWDEEMLLAEEERRREAVHPAVHPAVLPPPVPVVPGPPERHPRNMQWMMTLGALQTNQAFTRGMASNFGCGYCPARLRSLADLRYHLSFTKRHSVYACCGLFFRNADEFEEHARSGIAVHQNVVLR
ncbi:hypothetical protein BDY19DRAFT_1060100 [Irpex rosettiformis]|uniref:Uncharacterized protein n=1 Tax=Irpex rosettiformis TaxID=378272 RepID=A0ACB8TRK2_9APHY|nr:hypothetical protein BDY19DRAFT_1060100 [Irpex rosettiformis]